MHSYLHTIPCPCGRLHEAALKDVHIGAGVLSRLPDCVRSLKGTRPFLLADENTWEAAGKAASDLLIQSGIPCLSYVFPAERLKPDEQAVGAAFMHYDPSCDLIIGIGSGVINDIGKLLSSVTGHGYLIVATAPSMDGYASATSSMDLGGLKVSLPSRCPDIILGDTNILKEAPAHMLSSGIGDMIAKYVSIAEWRIAHLITGEYYCPQVAELVRSALKKCTDHADGLLRRDPAAVEAVFEGLIIGGIAMSYAKVSRPASGVEHYFSHVWDMRALQFGTFADLHGIQCAMATLAAVGLYEALAQMTPDEAKAAAYVADFDYEDWKEKLRSFLGASAETMIAQEAREGKYRKEAHHERFLTIQSHWDEILQIIKEELPKQEVLQQLLTQLSISTDLDAIGVDHDCARMTFRSTKDIRDKYVLSRLAWDLGVLEDLAALL